jgi:DNA processing protein
LTLLRARPILFAMPDREVENLEYWLGFNMVQGIGPARLQSLLAHFGDIEAAWRATDMQLARAGLDSRSIENLVRARGELDLSRELERALAAGITILTVRSPGYPRNLREITYPPPVLFVRGALEETDRWSVAVVGTRRLTPYGRQVTRELVKGLVLSGVTIVSGLAKGIDTIAHQTALDMGGRTIAVMGCGPNIVYPPENRALADRILEGQGAILSEYALDVQPEARNFPPRNRVISGLALGVIVVEAGEKSGALITAAFALEQGREVFAVPGNITSQFSKGTNELIQQGAKLVANVEDVIEELDLELVAEKSAFQRLSPDTVEEGRLLGLLTVEPVHIDDLTRKSGLSSAAVSSTLTLMELKGLVQQVGGMNYVAIREPVAPYRIHPDD